MTLLEAKNNDSVSSNQNDRSTIDVARIIQERDSIKEEMLDYKEQVAALSEAICLLSEMLNQSQAPSRSNSEDKKQTSVEMEEGDVLVNECQLKSRKEIEQKIQHLHAKWKLEDTPFSSIYDSFLRLESNLQMVTEEADLSVKDNQNLLHSIFLEKKKSKKLEKIAINLLLENKGLKKKLEKKKKQRRSIVASVKEYLNNMQREKSNRDALILKYHENQLKEIRPIKSESSTFDENDSLPDEQSLTLSSSTLSTTSSCSHVLETGTATIQMMYEANKGWSSSFDSEKTSCKNETNLQRNGSNKVTVSQVKNKNYELKFPSGKKIGLQFQKVPLSNDETLKPSPSANQNKCSLQNSSQSHSQNNATGEIFVVCGFEGFDSSVNTPPKLGAKLIAIDDESLENKNQSLSFENLRSIIQSKAKPDGSVTFFTMTFRNDILNETQNAILKKAMAAVESDAREKSYSCSNSSCSYPAGACVTSHSNITAAKSIVDTSCCDEKENAGECQTKETLIKHPIKQNDSEKKGEKMTSPLKTQKAHNSRNVPQPPPSKLNLDMMTSRLKNLSILFE